MFRVDGLDGTKTKDDALVGNFSHGFKYLTSRNVQNQTMLVIITHPECILCEVESEGAAMIPTIAATSEFWKQNQSKPGPRAQNLENSLIRSSPNNYTLE